MAKAESGDTVKVHYVGTLTDGTEFDSSREREPMEFKVGDHMLLPDFEAAIIDMAEGEKKTVTIPCENAYGEHTAELDINVPRESLPEGLKIVEGTVLQARGPEGQEETFRVVGIKDDLVMMDGNHPLAGHDLTFELELVQITQKGTGAEPDHGIG